MYIAGEWSASENGDVSQAINPATGDSIATVPKQRLTMLIEVSKHLERLYKTLIGRIWILLKEDEY